MCISKLICCVRLIMNHIFTNDTSSSPLIYVLFIGGAADKESFLWGNVNLPLKSPWPHRITYHLARRFHFRMFRYLQARWHLPSVFVRHYYRCDYLSYTEIFYREAKRYHDASVPSLRLNPAFIRLCQNIGQHTQVFIVGHSLGGWNGAHLSRILAAHGIRCRFLVTLDPVGCGNHDIRIAGHLMRQAQIYHNIPAPVANKWMNIRGFHIRLAENRFSAEWENWVSWAGGQWLIKTAPPESHLLVNQCTPYSHRQAENMFTCPTRLGLSAASALMQEIEAVLQNAGLPPLNN